ncbi:hypothetical protein HYH03_013302 [Edaphochlamys debaryana]|uniref:phytol kinase n=1 Tax=Edaphochlamys debaryana TaxID=47281 RepID=A0A835XR20_9CHLO|nr:hypothetical protein HYH03_013302 [Edaphochlamys debaryana]|eukprot:KAG2488159.1 hypothetical protein HYH03_013302 [Edaphochlamys debaryana]
MRGHRRNRAAAGAAQQQKSAATLIRDLPELAERLLGVAGKHGRPRSAPSAAELAGLQESLKEALKIVIKDDEAACSVLQNDSVRVAWSVRLPAPDVSGAESAQLKAQRFFGFAAVDLAGSLAHTAFDYRYPGGGFAAELLRTQVLHALARQLASLNQALEGAQTPRPRRFWSSALLCITGAARLCLGLSPYPWQAGLDPALLAQLAEALADSHVVEHLARAILHAQAGPEAAAAAEHLSRVLLGPCAHHALLVIGLEALAVMEGALGLQEAGAAATCACRGGAAAAAAAESATIEMDTLVALQRCLGMATPHPQAAPPPGGCAAWAAVAPRPALSARLILRLGLAAAGGRPVQGIDAGSIIIIGSGGGGGSGSSSLPADGHRVLLKPQHRAELMWVALEDLGWQLLARRRRPWCGPWPGIAADLWRLAAVASRGEEEDVEARADSLADVISILTLSYLDRLLVAGKWLEYPAEAPLELAAALEGGALPLFERLLRRAGETPAGLEARALSEFCERTGSQACLIWIRVLPLLAYGEPLQAAAFVATVSKLLRRTQARALVADGTQCCAFGPMAACQLMCLRVVCESFEAAPDGGLPPAVRQLMLVLSLALPDWLADLVPLVREAAVLEEAAWREEQRKRDGGCAPGARSPPPASLPLHFALWALLGHLSRPFTSAEPTPAAADAEASAGVTNNGGGGGEFGSGGGGSGSSGAVASWPSRELADDAEVALVGVAMGLLQRRGMDALEAAYMGSAMAVAAIRLSATRPEDVRRALRANDPVFAWRPEAMQTVATAAREATVIIAAAEGLGRVLEAWARGEEGGEEVAVELWEGLQAAGKEAGLYGKAAGQLVPPAEARRRLGLPACSNPACVSLAGDSEAGRLLQLCGRCRREAYCCRECQTAHWRAGHKEACGGGGGKPA